MPSASSDDSVWEQLEESFHVGVSPKPGRRRAQRVLRPPPRGLADPRAPTLDGWRTPAEACAVLAATGRLPLEPGAVPADDQELERIVQERTEASDAIVNSGSHKKLIVAGPGTGKTFTFEQALRRAIADSGEESKGLALTFIRNLVADLSEALSDVADVFTFHGFCKHQMHRHAVAGLQEGWDYYPAPQTAL